MSDQRKVHISTEYVGFMPNQIEGTINGRPFYFRARHGSWRIEWSDTKETFAEGQGEKLGIWLEEPGWWEGEDASAFCRTVIGRYFETSEK